MKMQSEVGPGMVAGLVVVVLVVIGVLGWAYLRPQHATLTRSPSGGMTSASKPMPPSPGAPGSIRTGDPRFNPGVSR